MMIFVVRENFNTKRMEKQKGGWGMNFHYRVERVENVEKIVFGFREKNTYKKWLTISSKTALVIIRRMILSKSETVKWHLISILFPFTRNGQSYTMFHKILISLNSTTRIPTIAMNGESFAFCFLFAHSAVDHSKSKLKDFCRALQVSCTPSRLIHWNYNGNSVEIEPLKCFVMTPPTTVLTIAVFLVLLYIVQRGMLNAQPLNWLP